jgi:Glycosyltransferase family 28 C-terminal domain
MAELTATGTPAVMVPLPHAVADHQAANARVLAAAGGAVVVDDAALDGASLVGAAAPLLADPERLAGMAAAMRGLAHPDAAEELAALVVEASGRATREAFLASRATPVDREATGWFEAAAAPAGGPTVQRRVDHRSKRMEAYPPVERTAKKRPGGTDGPGAGNGTAAPPADQQRPARPDTPGAAAEGSGRGGPGDPGGVPRSEGSQGGAPVDREGTADAGGDPPGDGGATR